MAPTLRPWLVRRAFAIVALALAIAAPIARASADGLSPAAERVIRALRESRVERTRPEAHTVADVVEAGEQAIEPLVTILVERQLPPLGPDEQLQTLSEPQRRMLLSALSSWPAQLALDSIRRRLEAQPVPDPATRGAALYLYSQLGQAADLQRTLGLALTEAESSLAEDLERAFAAAVTGVLERDAGGFAHLRDLLRTARVELRPTLLHAAAATGDARAQPMFAYALAFEPDLTDVALAQTRLLGRSHDAEANLTLAAEARRFLTDKRTNLRAAAARAVGELRDPLSVPSLCAMLELDSRALEDAALWALRRTSGLSLPPTRAAWMGWFEQELATWDQLRTQVEKQLSHPDLAQRHAAVAALSLVQLYREEAALLLSPAVRDKDERLRIRVCGALERLGSPVAYPALLHARGDESELVRTAALAALESIAARPLPADDSSCRAELGL